MSNKQSLLQPDKNKKITEFFSQKNTQNSNKEALEDQPMKKSKNTTSIKSNKTNTDSEDTEIAEEILQLSSTSLEDEKGQSLSKEVNQKSTQIEKQDDKNEQAHEDDKKEQAHEDDKNKIQQEEVRVEQKQSSVSKTLVGAEKKQLRSDFKGLKNLQFYLNKLQSNPNGDFIQIILEKWYFLHFLFLQYLKGKFKLLETHHGYIQWLFPNFFQSRFNNGADPLDRQEADEFIKDKVIANRLKKAYDLIYEFFGMKIVNNATGEVQRTANFKERYHETYITSYHNHMRIRRILCHFNNVGFRRYAISLVKFLEKEIYGEKGYKKFQEDKRPIVIKWQEIPSTVPLRSLSKLKVFEEWSIYGEIDENDKEQVEILQDNCFATFEDIKRESIYFQGLKK